MEVYQGETRRLRLPLRVGEPALIASKQVDLLFHITTPVLPPCKYKVQVQCDDTGTHIQHSILATAAKTFTATGMTPDQLYQICVIAECVSPQTNKRSVCALRDDDCALSHRCSCDKARDASLITVQL